MASAHEVLAAKRGKFGPIKAIVTPRSYEVLINDQVQGAAALRPDATIVDPYLSGPGPIPISRYVLGWHMIVWSVLGDKYKHGTVFMVGLGSGIGPVSLLYEFPELQLTVVDIDPNIIEIVRQTYPLVEYYENEGRLVVICSDYKDYVAYASQRDMMFDIAMYDAYTGAANQDIRDPSEDISDIAIDLACNIISCNAEHTRVRRIAALYRTLMRPAVAFTVHPYLPLGRQSCHNVLLTSVLDLDVLVNVTPFADAPLTYSVQAAREAWKEILHNIGSIEL